MRSSSFSRDIQYSVIIPIFWQIQNGPRVGRSKKHIFHLYTKAVTVGAFIKLNPTQFIANPIPVCCLSLRNGKLPRASTRKRTSTICQKTQAYNLAIILTFHIRREGRREKTAGTYNKDGSLSGIHLPEQILLFLLGQWREGLKVSRRELYRWSAVRWGCATVWFDPPPLTPIVLREHKGSCQTLLVSASAKPTNGWKLPLPVTNQETKRKATVCLLKQLFFLRIVKRAGKNWLVLFLTFGSEM